MNQTQLNALKVILADEQYKFLLDAGAYVDLMHIINAKEIVATPNPDPQEDVTIIPAITDLFVPAVEGGDPIIPYAEQGALRSVEWDTVVGAVGATEATARIDALLFQLGVEKPRIYQVAQKVVDNNPTLIPGLLATLEAGSYLSTATVAAINDAMSVPDPEWQETLYSLGESVVSAAGLPNATTEDITAAIALG